jgi:ribonuclease J
MSASAIPGNERTISDTVNNLFKEGADVFYGSEAQGIHSSGHAKRDELQRVIETIKPEYFIPIHGEYRHLVLHTRLAVTLGVKEENAVVLEDGQIFEIQNGKASIAHETADASYVLVDGLGVGDVGNIVIRDRQAMAKDGIFVVILTVNHETGKIVTSPDIISRGFIYMREREDLVYKARQEVKKMFARHNEKYPANWDFIKKSIRQEMGDLLYKETERKPMIIPVIIEV